MKPRGLDRANVCANDCAGLYADDRAAGKCARIRVFAERAAELTPTRTRKVQFCRFMATEWGNKKPLVNWVSHLMSTMGELVKTA
jgi:hypothetical protein